MSSIALWATDPVNDTSGRTPLSMAECDRMTRPGGRPMSPRLRVVLAAALVAFALRPQAAAPIRVMLLDGESGGPWHKWQLTTPVLKKLLDETTLFQVD